jgi:hypothetical protein
MVDAHTEHLRLRLDELLVITSQGGELVGSTRTEVENVEGQQHMTLLAIAADRDWVAIGGRWKRKLWSEVADTGHLLL